MIGLRKNDDSADTKKDNTAATFSVSRFSFTVTVGIEKDTIMYKLILPDHVVSGLRIISFVLFLFFAIDINTKSIATVLVVLGE